MVGLEEVAVVGEEDGRGGDAGRRDVGVFHMAALVRMEVWVGTGVSLITYTSGNECRRVEKSSLAELEERAWGTAPMGAPRGAEARTAVPRASRCIRRVSRMERVVKDRGREGRQEILRSPPAPWPVMTLPRSLLPASTILAFAHHSVCSMPRRSPALRCQCVILISPFLPVRPNPVSFK